MRLEKNWLFESTNSRREKGDSDAYAWPSWAAKTRQSSSLRHDPLWPQATACIPRKGRSRHTRAHSPRPGPAQRRAAGGISLSPLSFMACRTSSTPHNHGRSGIVSRQFLATHSYKMTCGNHADYDPTVDYHFPRGTPEDHPSRAQTAPHCGSLTARRRSAPAPPLNLSCEKNRGLSVPRDSA